MSVASALRNIEESLRYLLAIASAQREAAIPDLDRLLEGYLEARRSLARDFRELAVAMNPDAIDQIQAVKAGIGDRMRALFSSAVPERLLMVRGYGKVHAELLAYLIPRIGTPVMASKLRVLVGDQIHTERRVRDLRDLGFAVSWRKVAGEDQYLLGDANPDLEAGARRQLALNVRADRHSSADTKAAWLSLAEVSGR